MINGSKYSEQEIDFLQKNYLHMEHKDIARKLGRPWRSIAFKCQQMGLIKHKKKEIGNIDYTPSLAYVFGCMCGDATFLRHSIRLGVKDKDFAEEFYKHIQLVLSHTDINIKSSCHRDIYFIQIYSLALKEYLIQNYGQFRTFDWKVPDWIFQSSNQKIIGYFLKGLFDSEGNFHQNQIRLQTVSKEMQSVSQLLFKLGIYNRLSIEKRLTTAGNKVYSISISSQRNIGIFRKKIGFSIKRKQAKLIDYMVRCERKRYKNKLLFNHRREMTQMYKQGYSLKAISNQIGLGNNSLNSISNHIKKVLKQDYNLYSQKHSLLKGRWIDA